MSMPGFIKPRTQLFPLRDSGAGARQRREERSMGVSPAACVWYDWFYAPVACRWVTFNETYGIGGYGPSPCAAWQIPFDPVGCAALPRSRNRF